MNADEQFFYDHAGYGYDPKTETAKQGRKRGAREMAAAEAWAKDHLRYVWEDDWAAGSHIREFDTYPDTCETCITYDVETGEVLAAFGCVDNADVNDYGRVIEAELAMEAQEVWGARAIDVALGDRR